MTAPQIAIAVPAYRRPELLQALIRSLPSSIPVIVSDNDGSMAGLSIPFPDNVKVRHADRLVPVFANWNRAISLVPANATHVLIPSDDDLYLPKALDTIESALRRHPEADMVLFGCDFIDEHGKTSPGWKPTQERSCEPGEGFLSFEYGVDVRMPAVLFRKGFLDRIGVFDERFELTAADSELIQRATLLGRTVFVPETIGLYRVWSGSLTYTRQATDLWMDEIVMWTDKISALLRDGHQPASRRIDVRRYKAETFALNLLAGLNNLRAKGALEEARAFMARYPVPAGAKLKTRLRLLRCRLALRSDAS